MNPLVKKAIDLQDSGMSARDAAEKVGVTVNAMHLARLRANKKASKRPCKRRKKLIVTDIPKPMSNSAGLMLVIGDSSEIAKLIKDLK